MTEEEIRQANPWKKIAARMLQDPSHCLFDATNAFVGPEDSDKLMSNNVPTSEYDLVTSIPPEPWQGNPLTARLIILTLNPGYIDQQNRILAERIQNIPKIVDSIAKFKAGTLLLCSKSFLPEEPEEVTGPTAADYINIIGDWYWYKKITPLFKSIYETDKSIHEKELFEKVAIMQYLPYTSVSYKDKNYDGIKSMKYSQTLLKYILENRRNVTVLVLRAKSKWEKIINNMNKDDSNIVIYNSHRCQSISENNLKDNNNFYIIKKALLCKTSQQ